MSATPEPDDEIVDAEVVEVVPGGVVDTRPPTAAPAPDYDARGVPSLDYVRDKIEGRYATSLGAGELAAETKEGRTVAEQEAERAEKAAAKLAEIRRSLQ